MRQKIKEWYRFVFLYEANKVLEKLMIKTAWMMPRWLVYWCAIRLIGHATTGRYGNTVVPELSAMDALKRWEER